MGLFWDLMQQSQISQQQTATGSLEQRVAALETQLHQTRDLQHRLIKLLEAEFQRDLDGDGKVG